MSAIGDWSESLNSTYTKDETLAFESPILKAAFETWNAAGGIPPRSYFTPRLSKEFLGNLVIFERHETSFHIRLMGTRISAILGEMQGKLLEDALPAEVAVRWKDILTSILTNEKPLRVIKTVAFRDLHYLEAELCLAPLLDGQGQLTMVFAAAVFRSGVTSKSKLGEIIAAAR